MRFLTRQHLEDRWGTARVSRLAEAKAGAAGDPAAEIDKALADAEAEALSILSARPHLAERLPTTPDTTPVVLRQAVADLAIHNLALAHELVDEGLETARNRGRKALEAMRDGRQALTLSSRPAVDQPAKVAASTTPGDFVFGHGGLDGW